MGQVAWLDLAEVGRVLLDRVLLDRVLPGGAVLAPAAIHPRGLAGLQGGYGLVVDRPGSHQRPKRFHNELNGSRKCTAAMLSSCSDFSGKATRRISDINQYLRGDMGAKMVQIQYRREEGLGLCICEESVQDIADKIEWGTVTFVDDSACTIHVTIQEE